jgi:Ca2+-binding RTX toxin-like protein
MITSSVSYVRKLMRKNSKQCRDTGRSLLQRSRPLRVEPLEARQLLSVTEGLANSVLSVTGTPDVDEIQVRRDGADVVVNYSTYHSGTLTDSGTFRHNAGLVNSVKIDGGAEGDTLDASSFDKAVTLLGGAGNDKLIGGTNNDTLNGGTGVNDLIGGGGVDTYIASGAQGDVVELPDPNQAITLRTLVQVRGVFLDTWLSNGGQTGVFGAATDDAQPGTGGVTSQRFEGGLLFSSPPTGLLVVPYHLPAAAQAKFDAAYDPVRAKFLSQFFFNGFVADSIYQQNGLPSIKFGDQTKQMGDALLQFAQESAILANAGLDSTPSENVVQIILHAFDQLDHDAEMELYGRDVSGFFLRDYIGKTGPERQGIPATFGNRIDSDFISGMDGKYNENPDGSWDTAHPLAQLKSQYTDPVLSADQTAHMMCGWWAVTQYSGRADSGALARDQARKVMDYWISVRYQLPSIDGVDVGSGRGRDARLNAGFLSHMADAVTGDGYFWRGGNLINVGYIDNASIINAVKNGVRNYVDYATMGLSAAARDLFDWDPVSDVFDAIKDKMPDRTAINLPVWFAHNTLLTLADLDTIVTQVVLGVPIPIVEGAFTGDIALNQFLPSPIRAILDVVSFDVPTGVSYSAPSLKHPLGEISLDTKTVSLESLLGEIKVPLPGGSPVPPFSRDLALVMMAFDPDVRVSGRFNDLAMADTNPSMPGVQPDVWPALLRPAVFGQSPTPEVVSTAKAIAATAAFDGPKTGGANGWSSRNRWETGAANETVNGNPAQYNGHDFLSLETLIGARGLAGVWNGPPVELVPNANDPSLLDLQVRGTDGSDTIGLIRRVGNNIEVVINGKSWGLWQPTGEVFVHGRNGGDSITIDGDLGLPTHLCGDDGDDTFALIDGAGDAVTIAGGAGSNTIIGDDSAKTWTINGADAGSISNGVAFSGIQNLIGGANVDNFVFTGGGSLAGRVDGKGGADTLDFSAGQAQIVSLVSPSTIDGFDGTATGSGASLQSFSNVNTILGSLSQSGDTLTGLNSDAVWAVTAGTSLYTQSSNGRTLSFSQFDVLSGGAGVDAFNIGSTGSAIAVHGNGGGDIFNVATGNLDAIAGALTITGDGGNDKVLLKDGGNSRVADYQVYPTTVSSATSSDALPSQGVRFYAGLAYDGSVESLQLDATNARNVLDVQPSLNTTYDINGNGPVPGTVLSKDGDYLKLDTKTTFPVNPQGLDTSGRKLTITSRGNGYWDFTKTTNKRVQFESIERFNHVDIVAAGADAGTYTNPTVQVFDAETNELKFTLPAQVTYGVNYRNGIRVATGDMDNDGLPDVVVAPGRLMAPTIKVFNGAPMVGLTNYNREITAMQIPASATYGKSFINGVQVAVGDVVGDGLNDIILVPSRGTSIVKVFQNQLVAAPVYAKLTSMSAVRSFDAFRGYPSFIGGATLATADLNGNADGSDKQQIIVASGSGMRGLVSVFDVVTNRASYNAIRQIFDPDSKYTGGLNVTVGDVDGDGIADIITGSGNAGSAWVRIYSGKVGASNVPVASFLVFSDRSKSAPTRVVARDIDGDGRAEIFAAQGADGRNSYQMKRFKALTGQLVDTYFAGCPDFFGGGVFLG